MMAPPQPLTGRHIVVTRQATDAAPLMHMLQHLGATVTCVPSIVCDLLPLDAECIAKLSTLPKATHLVFASRHAVQALAAACARVPAARWGLETTLLAVGPATAASVQQAFGRGASVATPHTAEGLAAWLVADCTAQAHVFLPGARAGRTVVAEALAARHIGHTVIPLYATQAAASASGPLPQPVDYVLFTSPSTVDGFLAQVPWPRGARAISMGPSTSQALVSRGLTVYSQAKRHTLEGLVAATLEEH